MLSVSFQLKEIKEHFSIELPIFDNFNAQRR